MKLNKVFNLFKESPYLIGRYLLAPIIGVAIAFLFQRGNTSATKHIDGYIQNSETIQVEYPDYELTARKIDTYHDEYDHMKTYWGKIFYSDSIKKYVSIIMFEGYNYYDKDRKRGDLVSERIKSYFHKGNIFLVCVNRVQLNDAQYGTKENPIPAFWYKFVSGRIEDTFGHKYDPNNPYHCAQDTVTEESNRIFVEQYLTRFMSKKECDRLYNGGIKYFYFDDIKKTLFFWIFFALLLLYPFFFVRKWVQHRGQKFIYEKAYIESLERTTGILEHVTIRLKNGEKARVEVFSRQHHKVGNLLDVVYWSGDLNFVLWKGFYTKRKASFFVLITFAIAWAVVYFVL